MSGASVRRLGIGIVLLGVAGMSSVVAQPGGGSPECWDIDTTNLEIDDFVCSALVCDEPWQEKAPGDEWKSVNTYSVWLNCRTCPGEWVDGICEIDLYDCGPASIQLHDYDVEDEECGSGGGGES